jgi:hypothetical protein
LLSFGSISFAFIDSGLKNSWPTHASQHEYNHEYSKQNEKQITPMLGLIDQTSQVVDTLETLLDMSHLPELAARCQLFVARLRQLRVFALLDAEQTAELLTRTGRYLATVARQITRAYLRELAIDKNVCRSLDYDAADFFEAARMRVFVNEFLLKLESQAVFFFCRWTRPSRATPVL